MNFISNQRILLENCHNGNPTYPTRLPNGQSTFIYSNVIVSYMETLIYSNSAVSVPIYVVCISQLYCIHVFSKNSK